MSVQLPPFWHGDDSHGFTKRREIYDEYGYYYGEYGEYCDEC
jgi:hypothetical protein